ncbi:MAG TPA: NADH-quinone oxidoreductase subunit D [Candidatus Omnitrophica bacterium]|nr:NADH-quinone oxidoreductase subunit D [Candidatus Omnitrophota bacterium]
MDLQIHTENLGTQNKPQAAFETEDFEVSFGPQHPSTHGVLRLQLTLDGEVVIGCVPHIGYLHRDFEKICENRTYTQIIPYTDRLDYLGAMNNNFGYCMAIEKLMGLAIPERADYIRVIIAELNRIASHLLAVGTFVQDLGAFGTPLLYCFREREKILDIFESTCGSRLTYNYYRIGGVSADIPADFQKKVKEFIDYFKPKLKEYEDLMPLNAILLVRTKGIGILSKEKALAYAVTGPNLRASGVKFDLRKEEPYSIYPRFEFDIPVITTGDTWDRLRIRMDELYQSLRIIEQAIDNIPQGEHIAKVPKILKPPAGEIYFRSESPRGELGFYVISDGSTKPYRLKCRAPSFCNLAVISDLVKGVKVADVIAILGSLFVVLGEIDR